MKERKTAKTIREGKKVSKKEKDVQFDVSYNFAVDSPKMDESESIESSPKTELRKRNLLKQILWRT